MNMSFLKNVPVSLAPLLPATAIFYAKISKHHLILYSLTWLSYNFISDIITTIKLPSAVVNNQAADKMDFMEEGA